MTGSETQPSTDDVMREQKLQRNLKIVVGVLGLLIVLGLGAVILKVFGFATTRSADLTAKTIVAVPGTGSIAVEIPKGARVVSVSLSGGRLAVHHDGPSGAGIAILDLETGRRIVDVKPVEALPRN